MAASRRRLDAELVRRSLVESREQAKNLITSQQITVNGAVASKPAHQVLPGDALEVLHQSRFVGRGGLKLEGALHAFEIDPTGLRCFDVGSSTGGFTDALLQAGAAAVVALDVGRAQLHERLRTDARVEVFEQTDIRTVEGHAISAPFPLVVVDVSFIGLGQILTHLGQFVAPDGSIVALVKPQFEAGREEASKGKGVIRDPDIWSRVLDETVAAVRHHGLVPIDITVSPLKGGAGNVEFFLWIGGPDSPHTDGVDAAALEAVLAHAGELP